jgi:hypothetical protein
VDRVFYATSEAAARNSFVEMKRRWQKTHPSAVATIERDLDSVLRFYEWEDRYGSSLFGMAPVSQLAAGGVAGLAGPRVGCGLAGAFMAATIAFAWAFTDLRRRE